MRSASALLSLALGLSGTLAGCEEDNPLFGFARPIQDGATEDGADANLPGGGSGGSGGSADNGGSAGTAGSGGTGGNAADVGSPDLPGPSDGGGPEAPAVVPNARLIGHWSFDDTRSPLVARDDSGHGHHGMLDNLTPALAWVAARRGGGLSMDGQADNRAGIVVAPTKIIDDMRAFTIAAWVMRAGEATDTSVRGVLSRQQAGTEQCVKLAVRGPALVAFVPSTGPAPSEVAAANAVPLQTWTHIAATYDGALLAVYANGARLSASPFPNILGSTTTPMYIGTAKTTTKDQPFQGLIDDAVIFSFAMTPTQVKALSEGAAPSSF